MQTYNFNVIQNSSFSTNINVQNSDGTFVNLTGYIATGVVRYLYSSKNYLFPLNVTIDSSYISGLIIVSGNMNLVGTGIPVGAYPYDIRVYNTLTNQSLNVLNGFFNVLPEISY